MGWTIAKHLWWSFVVILCCRNYLADGMVHIGNALMRLAQVEAKKAGRDVKLTGVDGK